MRENANKKAPCARFFNMRAFTQNRKSVLRGLMHLGHKNQLAKYTLYGRELEVTDAEKDLEVMMDEKLIFHIQTAAAVKKANQILGLVKRTFASRDVKTVLLLYKAMVRPHLEYGKVIWGPFLVQYQSDRIDSKKSYEVDN